MSWSIDVWDASAHMPPPLALKMKEEAKKTDAPFLKQFSAGLPASPEDLWASAYGKRPTSAVAMMCLERHRRLHQEGMLRLALSAADAYLRSEPTSSTYPGTCGAAIALLAASHRLTKDGRYLARAESLADRAVETYWGRDDLPRATPRDDHYENITGADTLSLVLYELWSVKRRPQRPMTFAWIDR